MVRASGQGRLICSVQQTNAMANKERAKEPTIVGVWVNGDEYKTDVEYQVSRKGEGFAIRAVDRFDGERAEVYDVNWDGEILTFSTHWPSSGRFVKCRLMAISPNRVDFTYTYTQQEMRHRKRADPVPEPNRRQAARPRFRKPARGRGRGKDRNHRSASRKRP